MTTFTNPHERIEQLMLKIERLERAGDVLAHNLTFPTYEPELSAWWNLRGGVDACTVCNPAETKDKPYPHTGKVGELFSEHIKHCAVCKEIHETQNQ